MAAAPVNADSVTEAFTRIDAEVSKVINNPPLYYILFYRLHVDTKKVIVDDPICWTFEDVYRYTSELAHLQKLDHIKIHAHGPSIKK